MECFLCSSLSRIGKKENGALTKEQKAALPLLLPYIVQFLEPLLFACIRYFWLSHSLLGPALGF